MTRRPMRLAATVLVAGLLFGVGTNALPVAAQADEASDLQAKVEQTSKDYNAATKHLQDVQADIDANQQKLDDLNAQMPELKREAASSINSSYKLSQSSNGLIDMLLSAENFNDLVSAMNYLDIIAGKNYQAIDRLVEAREQAQETQDKLAAQKTEAQNAQAKAEDAMNDAIAARKEAQQRAAKELAAQQAEAQKAVEDAEKAEKDGQTTFKTESGNTATISTPEAPQKSDDNASSNGGSQKQDNATPSTPNTGAVTWSARDEFVKKWSGRIDAYLAGSPMAGHGKTFAEAAYDNGVDPRFSPAIANVESSKGLYCFKPHNAWGWGSSGWGDWDSAIRDHVAGLASGYGYTVSVSVAKKYCPPNWQFWYSAVLSNMNSI